MECIDLHVDIELSECEKWKSQSTRLRMYVHVDDGGFTRHFASSVWGT
jgi:hypothetical protein